MTERLFVYGTLHPDHAPGEIADIVAQFKRLGTGTVHGRLYDLGDYPAMVLDATAGPVAGEVFAVPDDPKALGRLDAYEEYSPESPEKSLFLRRKARVALDDGSQPQCWVYVYNEPLPADRSGSQLASVA